MKVVKANCPACGAVLEIAENTTSAKCPYCQSKIFLKGHEGVAQNVHISLGLDFLRAGNPFEAEKQFSKGLEKDPKNSDVWFWKSMIAALNGTFDEANVYWQKSNHNSIVVI